MKKFYSIIFAITLIQTAFTQAPEWSKDLTIYEVNIRQYTPEGTFDAFAEHLPRLQEMGAGIIHPQIPNLEKSRILKKWWMKHIKEICM